MYQKSKLKPVTGLCPVQMVKVINKDGKFVEVLAMLGSGSNTNLLSKSVASQLGLNCSATHLTMNMAGGKEEKRTYADNRYHGCLAH